MKISSVLGYKANGIGGGSGSEDNSYGMGGGYGLGARGHDGGMEGVYGSGSGLGRGGYGSGSVGSGNIPQGKNLYCNKFVSSIDFVLDRSVALYISQLCCHFSMPFLLPSSMGSGMWNR